MTVALLLPTLVVTCLLSFSDAAVNASVQSKRTQLTPTMVLNQEVTERQMVSIFNSTFIGTQVDRNKDGSYLIELRGTGSLNQSDQLRVALKVNLNFSVRSMVMRGIYSIKVRGAFTCHLNCSRYSYHARYHVRYNGRLGPVTTVIKTKSTIRANGTSCHTTLRGNGLVKADVNGRTFKARIKTIGYDNDTKTSLSTQIGRKPLLLNLPNSMNFFDSPPIGAATYSPGSYNSSFIGGPSSNKLKGSILQSLANLNTCV